jgi:primosomal protein N''
MDNGMVFKKAHRKLLGFALDEVSNHFDNLKENKELGQEVEFAFVWNKFVIQILAESFPCEQQ